MKVQFFEIRNTFTGATNFIPYAFLTLRYFVNKFRKDIVFNPVIHYYQFDYDIDLECDVFCFNHMVWSKEINYKTIEKIKEKKPNALIIIGGREVPIYEPLDDNFFELYPGIDIVVHGPGEEVLLDIFNNMNDFSNIKNITLNKNGKPHRTPLLINNKVLINYNYDDEYFFKVKEEMDSNKNCRTIMYHLEHSKGCPFNCTFCSWTKEEKKPLVYSKLILYKNILTILKNSKKNVMLQFLDPNFGILKDDEKIIDFLILIKKKYRVKFLVDCITNKKHNDYVIRILNKLSDNEFQKHYYFAMQTFNANTFKIIKRPDDTKNSLERIEKILSEKQKVSVIIEMILGLPGETKEMILSYIKYAVDLNLKYKHNKNKVYSRFNNLCFIVNADMNNQKFIDEYGYKYIEFNISSDKIEFIKTMTSSNILSESDLLYIRKTLIFFNHIFSFCDEPFIFFKKSIFDGITSYIENTKILEPLDVMLTECFSTNRYDQSKIYDFFNANKKQINRDLNLFLFRNGFLMAPLQFLEDDGVQTVLYPILPPPPTVSYDYL